MLWTLYIVHWMAPLPLPLQPSCSEPDYGPATLEISKRPVSSNTNFPKSTWAPLLLHHWEGYLLAVRAQMKVEDHIIEARPHRLLVVVPFLVRNRATRVSRLTNQVSAPVQLLAWIFGIVHVHIEAVFEERISSHVTDVVVGESLFLFPYPFQLRHQNRRGTGISCAPMKTYQLLPRARGSEKQ